MFSKKKQIKVTGHIVLSKVNGKLFVECVDTEDEAMSYSGAEMVIPVIENRKVYAPKIAPSVTIDV